MHNKHEYELYLQSDHWAALRQQAFATHGVNCELCKRLSHLPHVHHIRYRNLLDVTTDDLAVLCESCNSMVHRCLRRHPEALNSRDELFHWQELNTKRRAGVTRKKLHDKQNRQAKHYKNAKPFDIKGFFSPAPNKPPERKQIFFSRLEQEQTKASRMASALVDPAPIIQTQVDEDAQHHSS